MSWKPEFEVEGKWCNNGQNFATKEESDKSAYSRFFRWTMPTDWRSVEVDTAENPVNYKWVDTVGDVSIKTELKNA